MTHPTKQEIIYNPGLVMPFDNFTYESPNKNDDDTIKFGGLDPCQVHVQIMEILHASGRKAKEGVINHFYCLKI